MSEILISNGSVITLDPDRRVIEGGAVLIRDDRIAAVGGAEVEALAAADARIIDASRKAVMPGLIDCHGHAGHSLTKNLGAGSEGWVDACVQLYTTGSDRQFWQTEARLASLERLKAGTTTAVSFFGGGSDVIRNDAPDYALAYGDAVGEGGTRSYIAIGPNRHPYPHRFVRGEDGQEVFTDEDQEFATAETVLTEGQGKHQGRVNYILFAPLYHPSRGMDTVSLPDLKAFFERLTDLRSRIGCILTQDAHRDDSIAFGQKELGTVGPWSLFSHSIDLTEESLEIAAEVGLTLAHNPSAVMSIIGRCPAPEAIQRGINVAISTDAGAPDRGYDLFRQMFQAQHYHRRHFRNPDVLPAGKVLEMVTLDAAKGIGRAHDLGSLEVGKKADVILIDLMKPHLVPLNHVVSRLSTYANAGDVDTVIVDGVIRMEGRKVLSVDEGAILEEAIGVTERVIRDNGLDEHLDMPDGFWRESGLK